MSKLVMFSQNINNLVVCLILVSHTAMALTGDLRQPVTIQSQEQSFDLIKNYITFTGNVSVTQGSINIHADKVSLMQHKDKTTEKLIEAYGTPVTFSQVLDRQQTLRGSGQKIIYDTRRKLIMLEGKAAVYQGGSCVRGDHIIYELDQRKIKISSTDKNRVTMVLQPKDLKKVEKNIK